MIDVPEFVPQHLDLSRFDGDVGAAFQALVGELLLAEGVDAHAFPAAGKDGGIDLIEELEDGGLRVYECKVTGGDDVLKAALQRWKKTANNLTRNLASPDGPPTGQSQYIARGTTPTARSAPTHSASAAPLPTRSSGGPCSMRSRQLLTGSSDRTTISCI